MCRAMCYMAYEVCGARRASPPYDYRDPGVRNRSQSAIFSIADALLLKRLPVREPERLFQIQQPDGPRLRQYGERFALTDYRELMGRASHVVDLAAEVAASEVAATIEHGSEEMLRRGEVSDNYFTVLGVTSALGRTISAEDERAPDQPPVAVIGYGFWKRRFNLDPEVTRRVLRIGGTGFQIIGVTQYGFFGLELGSMTDVWTLVALEARGGRGSESSGASSLAPRWGKCWDHCRRFSMNAWCKWSDTPLPEPRAR
jgi:hypothetical protein